MTDPAPRYIRPKDIDNRSSFGQRLQWRLEAIGWDVIYWWPMKLIGLDNASRFCGWLARTIGPLLSQHKTTLRNLRLAFPDWTQAEIDAVARAAWQSVGQTAGELPHLGRIDPYEPGGRVEIVGVEHLDAVTDSGRGAVMVSGHFSNWEVMAAAICRRPADCVITYRALNNPYIDRRLNKARADYGTKFTAPKGLATRELMRSLARGQSVGIMNDQKFREGVPVTFFGHEAMTAPGPSRLAVRYAVPILPVSTQRTGPGRFRVTFHPHMTADTTLAGDDARVMDLTRRITAFIEAEVRANPGQWFWMHRRWPKEAWREAAIR